MRWYISTYITKEEEKKKTTVNSQRSVHIKNHPYQCRETPTFQKGKKEEKQGEKKQKTENNSQ